jgi:predicted RNase H-like HicB family nuclease
MRDARARKPNPAVVDHPLHQLRLKVKIEWDPESRQFVTFVPELGNISTYGPTEEAALDATADMLLGFIDVAQQEGVALPLSASELTEIRAVLAGR